ncbi:MAG: signal peptidase I [Pseudorhodoplanes sp.]|nr:signal peptidase I [Pseudorhodoplanes sp.]
MTRSWPKVILASCLTILAAATIFTGIRTVLFQPFRTNGVSMLPTVAHNDFTLVAKYSYGYSRYSIPFSPPLFSGRIFASEPERGDIVVYRLPKDNSADWFARIVGLPGDRIRMNNGQLHINGQPVPQVRVSDFIANEGLQRQRIKRWRETLPNGTSYETLDLIERSFYDNTPEYLVPAGHYFMMGDNRDNASDSRVLSAVGYVPFENLVGRVITVFLRTESPGSPSEHAPKS